MSKATTDEKESDLRFHERSRFTFMAFAAVMLYFENYGVVQGVMIFGIWWESIAICNALTRG